MYKSSTSILNANTECNYDVYFSHLGPCTSTHTLYKYSRTSTSCSENMMQLEW